MTLKVHSTIDAKIVKVSDAGLEVEAGDCEGIVRIIDLKWDTHGLLETIRENYKVHEAITVKVMAVDGKRFLGSVKDLFPDKNPWCNPEQYKAGEKFSGKINKVVDFGYFISLETGATALMLKEDKKGGDGKEQDSVEVIITQVDPSLEKIMVSEI